MARTRCPLMLLLLLLVVALGALGAAQEGEGQGEGEAPVVRVAQGLLRGVRVRSPVARPFFAFRGVPYARPPLGERRFQDATPAEPWEGVRDAAAEGSTCTQLSWESGRLEGGEDCLFLNVYTPRLPSASSPPLPVMVWIHGGGFVFGAGGARDYGPDYLLEEDVLLVTLNYRLGCLGFLFLDEAAPGNAGMKDQVLALRWVRDNVAAFGGDPRRVTIFGQSSGAESVQYHMLSPMSQGLFHGAIAMSGAAVNAYMHAPYETSRRLAAAVGCEGDDAALLRCLRAVDARRLVQAAETEAPTPRDRARIMLFSFYPTAEELRVRGVETFVAAPPQQLAARACHSRVPFMTGLTDAEWMLVQALNASVWGDAATLSRLDSDWPAYVVPETRLRPDDPRLPQAEADLRAFFMDGRPLDEASLPGYQAMFSDLIGGESTYYTIYHMAEAETSPIYYYVFTVDDTLNFLKFQFNLSAPGAAHADDLGYLFHVPRLPAAPRDSPAALARRRLVRLYANFAKFGDPTPAADPLLGARWPAYTRRRRAFLSIGADGLVPGEDLDAARVDFWRRFYRTYGAKGLRPAVAEHCPAPRPRWRWLPGGL